MKKNKVTRIVGEAKFISPEAVEVEGKQIKSKFLIIVEGYIAKIYSKILFLKDKLILK